MYNLGKFCPLFSFFNFISYPLVVNKWGKEIKSLLMCNIKSDCKNPYCLWVLKFFQIITARK